MMIEGTHVVVVGGTSGIGRAVAQSAEREGARVTTVSRRNGIDVTDEAAVRALFERVGSFEHLVFTAGDSLVLGKVSDVALADMRRAFDVRVFAALGVLKYARPTRSIVLTSGIAFLRPQSGWAVGAAICGAMEGVARAMAIELAPVRVNIVSPGAVRTPMWGGEVSFAGPVAAPEDVAETYLHLIRSPFTTGQVAIVDGGAVLL